MQLDINLLTKTFKDYLKNEYQNDIAGCYYAMFNILLDVELQPTLQYLYESYQEDKDKPTEQQYWFYSFHKSIRQGDFYHTCQRTYRASSITPEEKVELNTIAEKFNKAWKANKDEARKATPGIYHMTWLKDTYGEEYTRYRDLKERDNFMQVESINGYLDSTLWHLVHVDRKDFLRLTLLRTFKQHDLEMEMLDELSKIEDGQTDTES